MITVESLNSDSIDEIVARVLTQQRRVAQRHPMISPTVNDVVLAESLLSAARDVLVARRDGVVVGHIRGTTLDSTIFGHSVWINPEGLSYDDDLVLEHLYVALADRAVAEGALQHYVWLPDDETINDWLELGFSLMHRRGTMALTRRPPTPLPDGYTLRRGGIEDLNAALALDDHQSEAHEAGPSYALGLDDSSQREDWIETLEDPSVWHFIVECHGVPVAQCATFALPDRAGTFANTVHLSAVTVREEHRRLGVARAMVDVALGEAEGIGFEFAETNWRVTNRHAARYWTRYGFTPTYVRLHRHVGDG